MNDEPSILPSTQTLAIPPPPSLWVLSNCDRMKSYLSGMPELKLGLNDKILFEQTGRRSRGKAIDMDDMKFHQCVQLSRFESDRTISFIPPDGEFDLMTYRISSRRESKKPLIWVETLVEPHGRSRIEYLVKTKSQFKSKSIANNVQIVIPVPSDVDTPTFKVRSLRHPAELILSRCKGLDSTHDRPYLLTHTTQ